MAALFAPPSAWDEYTHWLTLPHEMVLNDSLLSLNTYTNSVAPTYALHQSFLGAALLLAGVPDGRLNVFNVFVSAATLALVWTTLSVLRIPRRLRIGASALCLALLTTSAHVFGFFYGDALTILGMAACCLGLSSIDRVQGRSEVLAAGFLVSCPLIGKGYGFVVALGTSILVLGVGLVLHLRARRQREVLLHQPAVAVAITSLLLIMFERVILYAVTVHPAESNELLSAAKALDTLSQFSAVSLAVAARRLLLPKHGTLFELWTVASGLLLITSMRRVKRETASLGSGLPLWHLTSGLVLLAVLFFALVPNPYLIGSMARYGFGLVPSLIVTLALLLARQPRWQVPAQRVLIGSAVFVMAWGDLPGYLNDFLPKKYWNLVARDGSDPETPLYITPALALGRKEPGLRALSARYLVLSEPADGFLSYRVMSYLGRSGFRGRLYSDTTTSQSSDTGQLAEAARTALRDHNLGMLESLLSEISVVVTNVPEQVTGGAVPRVMTKQDFLATLRDRFERPAVPPKGVPGNR